MAILTISRQFGSGGREIGRAVAECMGYDYIDKSRVFKEIREVGYKWEQWGKDFDEHSPDIWEKYDWSFRGFGALIQNTILAHAVKDKVVIMGRGGSFLLKGVPFALRIHVTAPLDSRIARIMRMESVDASTARWLAERTNRERSGFIYAVYGKLWDDPAEYDRFFDTGAETVGEIVAKVKELLIERDKLSTPESRKTLEMHATAARVRAGIITTFGVRFPTLDAEFDGRNIVIRGIIRTPKEHQQIEEEAGRLAGDLTIRCELHYRM